MALVKSLLLGDIAMTEILSNPGLIWYQSRAGLNVNRQKVPWVYLSSFAYQSSTGDQNVGRGLSQPETDMEFLKL